MSRRENRFDTSFDKERRKPADFSEFYSYSELEITSKTRKKQNRLNQYYHTE